jgi:heparan-alpha-glucosaminide N-acetyltransferase
MTQELEQERATPVTLRKATGPAPAAQEQLARVESKPEALQRLLSLDTYRGLIMVTLAFNGFGLLATADNHLKVEPDDPTWKVVQHQFEHVDWAGCSYWDLIQPSFMFMVGAAMAYSYLKRRAQGQSYLGMLGHAVTRSLVLIFLGIFLISNGHRTPGGQFATDWSLMNVLTQIGLGYTFLFLLWNRHFLLQGIAAIAILGGTWYLYTSHPHAGVDLATGATELGVTKEWAEKHLSDVPPAWHKGANVGHAIDHWLLNQLPTAQANQVWPVSLLPAAAPYRFNRGGYQTINFLPSLATMIFGLMCGELLRSSLSSRRKLELLFLAGAAGIGIGLALEAFGVCPIVKRIWTPAWALFSTGWCCLILGTLYGVIDVAGYRFWTFPLVVVGMNSIAIYVMSMMLKGWTAQTWRTHFGADIFKGLGDLNEPLLQATLVGLSFWLACLWMYRQKIFVRI